jgi:hypothetical protein
VPALSAFAAIESLMCLCGLSVVARAAASTGDGSLVYRAFGVKPSLMNFNEIPRVS